MLILEKLKIFFENGQAIIVGGIATVLALLFIIPKLRADMKIKDIMDNKKLKKIVIIYFMIVTFYILVTFLYFMKHPDKIDGLLYWYVY